MTNVYETFGDLRRRGNGLSLSASSGRVFAHADLQRPAVVRLVIYIILTVDTLCGHTPNFSLLFSLLQRAAMLALQALY